MENYPSFYRPERVGSLFYPDVPRIAEEAVQATLPAAGGDERRTHLLIIDMQIDFCHVEGTLSVPGALEDVRRLIEFIYRRAASLTSISCSLDSHLPLQIFHSSWWVDKGGNHPPSLTLISPEDVESGRWVPVYQPEWSRRYVLELAHDAKKDLTIWPYHVPLGGIGHALDVELWSAVFWHSLARRSQVRWWLKGSVARTEHYSAIQPEIAVPEDPAGGKNRSLLDLLRSQDLIFIAGQAASHCLLETVEDLVEEFQSQAGMLNRIFVLEDCTSPVAHPEIDFAAATEKRFEDFRQQGINFVRSTDPQPLA